MAIGIGFENEMEYEKGGLLELLEGERTKKVLDFGNNLQRIIGHAEILGDKLSLLMEDYNSSIKGIFSNSTNYTEQDRYIMFMNERNKCGLENYKRYPVRSVLLGLSPKPAVTRVINITEDFDDESDYIPVKGRHKPVEVVAEECMVIHAFLAFHVFRSDLVPTDMECKELFGYEFGDREKRLLFGKLTADYTFKELYKMYAVFNSLVEGKTKASYQTFLNCLNIVFESPMSEYNTTVKETLFTKLYIKEFSSKHKERLIDELSNYRIWVELGETHTSLYRTQCLLQYKDDLKKRRNRGPKPGYMPLIHRKKEALEEVNTSSVVTEVVVTDEPVVETEESVDIYTSFSFMDWGDLTRNIIRLIAPVFKSNEQSVYSYIYRQFSELYGIYLKKEAGYEYSRGYIDSVSGFKVILRSEDYKKYFEHILNEYVKDNLKKASKGTHSIEFYNKMEVYFYKAVMMALACHLTFNRAIHIIYNKAVTEFSKDFKEIFESEHGEVSNRKLDAIVYTANSLKYVEFNKSVEQALNILIDDINDDKMLDALFSLL